jgi:3-oxoacyl-[acyl-carrier protein] reductase
MIDLTNEVALVTGASRGIGQAIALKLAELGAVVIGTATSEAGAEKISAYLKKDNGQGIGKVLNVTNRQSIIDLIKQISKEEGLGHPSIVVNNAGITRDNLLMRMKDDEWNDIMETNLSSVFAVSKACLRGLMKARKGRIINVASVVGATGNAGQCNYAAAKAGIMGFTRSLAREVGSRNITVNAVAPGFIDTDMTRALADEQRDSLIGQIPLGCLGKPEDIANMVAFLSSSAGAYVTGQTLHVNGGMYTT